MYKQEQHISNTDIHAVYIYIYRLQRENKTNCPYKPTFD